MRICVLQPSYQDSACDYRHYDPPRDLSPLLPEHVFHHEFLNKASVFSQIQALQGERFDIYVNLCEGYRDSDVPSIDVIHALESLNLPFTGPTSLLYDPPKELMKVVARAAGVPVPAYASVDRPEAVADAVAHLRYPLFVKPAAYGDSMGVDEHSMVTDTAGLQRQAAVVIRNYRRALIESYVDGPEYTVLVCAHPDPARAPVVMKPVEFRFPEGERFKTYALKVTAFHPECNVPCGDLALDARLRSSAAAVFAGFSGKGYARLDFRVAPDGTLFFLEINFTCSVFYPDGYQGSADYVLQHDGLGQAGFLRLLIEEGLARHARRQLAYAVRPSGLRDGLFATRALSKGEVVFPGEGRAQRIVTRAHVERSWSAEDQAMFYRYAYPIGPEVYVLWDEDPAGWAPQNHSCDPNTAFAGLDLVARRSIGPGEELTVDYSTFYDGRMTPFDCSCGSPRCRGRVVGGKGLFGGQAGARDSGFGTRRSNTDGRQKHEAGRATN